MLIYYLLKSSSDPVKGHQRKVSPPPRDFRIIVEEANTSVKSTTVESPCASTYHKRPHLQKTKIPVKALLLRPEFS